MDQRQEQLYEMSQRSWRTTSFCKRQRTIDPLTLGLPSFNPNGVPMGTLFEGLPFELQTEIFVLTTTPLFPMVSHQSVTLSQVSRTWRALALTMPQLWSSFSFELPREEEISSHRRIQAICQLRSWLERSQNYPLDFKLTQEPSARVRSQAEHGAVLLSLLLYHSVRWRNVQVSIWNDSIAIVLNDITREFPLLRSLTISPAVSKTRHPFTFASLEGSWTQLTTIHLVNYQVPPSLDQVLRILSLSPNVKTFAANPLCYSITEPYTAGAITLTSLTRLHIIFQHGDGESRRMAVFENVIQICLSFLMALSMTGLRSLRLEWDIDIPNCPCVEPGSTACDNFIAFFRGIGPTLEDLGLLYLPLGHETLLRCFAQLPLLRGLQLKYSLGRHDHDPVNDQLLRGLTLPERSRHWLSPVTLPQLRTVKLETHGESCTPGCLSRFVHSRMSEECDSRCQRLERLEFFTELPLFERLPPSLQKWEDRLDISSRIDHGIEMDV